MSTGGNSSRGLHSAIGRNGPRVTGLCVVGMCGPLVGPGETWGVELCVAGVWGPPGGGGGRSGVVGLSSAGVCGPSGEGSWSMLRSSRACALGEFGPFGGGLEGRGRSMERCSRVVHRCSYSLA